MKPLFGKSADDTSVRPEPYPGSVVGIAYATIAVAMAISLTLNIYHDTHAHGGMLPRIIAWIVGVGIPLLVTFVSHLGAEVRFGSTGKTIIYTVNGLLMSVSAVAGTDVMKPVLGFWWALILAVAVDSTAMIAMRVLMIQRDLVTAAAIWDAGEELRRAEAEREELLNDNRRRTVTAGGNAGSGNAGSGNAGSGNAGSGNAAGNTAPPHAGTGRRPAARSSAPKTPGSPETGPGQGSGATVTPIRRDTPGDGDLLRRRAVALAEALEAQGRRLSFRAYMAHYGGNAGQVSQVVARVKAERYGDSRQGGDSKPAEAR